jgi:molybdopterin synthase sulfur carrier subunit
MQVQVSLFGAFREFEPAARIVVDVADGGCVADLRRAVQAYAQAHWPAFRAGLLARSAFASEEAVLRDGAPLPANGTMAVLPPVSGG